MQLEEERLYFQRFTTPLGEATLVWSEKGLRRLEFGTGKAEGKERRHEGFERTLGRYFAGKRERFNFPIDLREMTRFEKDVLEAARGIGYGETRSYSWLARRAGRPKGARAVGRALAKNPLPLVIPCHRVVRSDGSIGGFSMAGGVETKRKLLELERGGR
jgi:O-6-methylguanine DNA methyltransferase